MAQKLQKAGYAIRKTKHGFELEGIAQETIDKFSRRTKEIEEYAEEHHISNAEQKSRIGAKTREAKRVALDATQQQAAWEQRLTEQEFTAVRQRKRHQPQTAQQPDKAAQAALQFSLDHHLERKSVATDREILATAIKDAIGTASHEDVAQAFRQNSIILTVEENLQRFITTKEALSEEKQLILRATQSRNKYRPINEQYEPKNTQLNEQQRAAVKSALSSTDGIFIISGRAGTGKTTLMREVKEGILASGKEIFSFAPSSEASRGVQRSEGFENADTVAMLIADKQRHAALKNQVIWVDEAGMLSNKDMNKILAIAEAQSARMILSGDIKQHLSVERGDAMRIIQEHTAIKPVTVSKIQRQQHAGYKEAVQSLSNGQTEKGFKQLERIGAIHEIEDGQQRITAIADDYYRSAYPGRYQVKNVLVVSPTHADGEQTTRQIRQKLKAEKVLGEDEHNYIVFRNRQLTEAEKQRTENYRAGDFVVFHQNSKGIKAGRKLEITGIGESWLLAKDQQEKSYGIALSESEKFTVFEPKPIGISEHDKIRITANGKASDGRQLFNGSTFYVEGFGKDGSMRLSNGATIPPDFGHFTLGYVSTSHASQGKTASKVIISQSSATFRAASMEQFYVSVSRGKEAVSIYTDDKAHLLQAVSQSSQRMSATELMAKQPPQKEEINRASLFRRWQEKASETYNHLLAKNRNDGLQAASRTE